MFEDMAGFFGTAAGPLKDWRAEMEKLPPIILSRARDLEALRPEENGQILQSALDLRREFDKLAPEQEEVARRPIADLCLYLHTCANALHEYEISRYDTEAVEAAQDVAWAAVQVLFGMDGNYGDAAEGEAADEMLA